MAMRPIPEEHEQDEAPKHSIMRQIPDVDHGVGALESAARGAGQIIPFYDRANAAIGHVLGLDNGQSIGDMTQLERAKDAEAAKNHPLPYYGSMIAQGVASAPALAAISPAGAGGAMATRVGYSALNAAGRGDTGTNDAENLKSIIKHGSGYQGMLDAARDFGAPREDGFIGGLKKAGKVTGDLLGAGAAGGFANEALGYGISKAMSPVGSYISGKLNSSRAGAVNDINNASSAFEQDAVKGRAGIQSKFEQEAARTGTVDEPEIESQAAREGRIGGQSKSLRDDALYLKANHPEMLESDPELAAAAEEHINKGGGAKDPQEIAQRLKSKRGRGDTGVMNQLEVEQHMAKMSEGDAVSATASSAGATNPGTPRAKANAAESYSKTGVRAPDDIDVNAFGGRSAGMNDHLMDNVNSAMSIENAKSAKALFSPETLPGEDLATRNALASSVSGNVVPPSPQSATGRVVGGLIKGAVGGAFSKATMAPSLFMEAIGRPHLAAMTMMGGAGRGALSGAAGGLSSLSNLDRAALYNYLGRGYSGAQGLVSPVLQTAAGPMGGSIHSDRNILDETGRPVGTAADKRQP